MIICTNVYTYILQGVFGFINSHRPTLILSYTHDPLPPLPDTDVCHDSSGPIANDQHGRALPFFVQTRERERARARERERKRERERERKREKKLEEKEDEIERERGERG